MEFEDAPLSQVVEEINRSTPKAFVINNPTLNSIRLTGRFKVGDMESVKFALRDRFGITLSEDSKQVRLSIAD